MKMKYLVFGLDHALLLDNWGGAEVYQGSMVVTLNNVTGDLEDKIQEYNDTDITRQSEGKLVDYCIRRGFISNSTHEKKLREFYKL